MDDLLKPISSVTIKRPTQPDVNSSTTSRNVRTIPDAITVLQDSPSANELSAALSLLTNSVDKSQDAKVFQAANVVVSQIIPSWWDHVSGDSDLKDLKHELLDYLRRIMCLGLLVSKLKALVSALKNESHTERTLSGEGTRPALDVLAQVLTGDDVVQRLYERSTLAATGPRRDTGWKEIVSLLSSGRIISIAAEAEDTLKMKSQIFEPSWLSQGSVYSKWLGRNIGKMVSMPKDDARLEDSHQAAASLLAKSLMIGYQDDLVASLLESLPIWDLTRLQPFVKLITQPSAYQQRAILTSVLTYLHTRHLASILSSDEQAATEAPNAIGACAALVNTLLLQNDALVDFLSELCINIESSVLSRSVGLRRAVLVVLSKDDERLGSMFEKMLAKFGDQLFIRHATALEQESLAQLILLAAGYLQRSQPMLLFTVAKSSIQTHGTSNRLKASSERAQWLGMVVAMALSELTDKTRSKLVFDDETLQTSEARWYQKLVQCQDKLGDVKNLEVEVLPLVAEVGLRGSRKIATKPKQLRPKPTGGGLVTELIQAPSTSRIVELEDDEDEDDEDEDDEDEDEDLTPYAKPDSDPEDEDEDPTLVNRDKPKAPVYIRDLLTGLRESQNFDKHRIALETAAALIRRKATFGKEVSDHAAELLAVFMNLNDTFETDDFLELRQEAMISLVIAQPKIVAPLIAGSSLEGNYSIQQRAAMLTALAMGARELAGFKDEDHTATPQFPSKELPEHLKRVYDEHLHARLDFASQKLEQSMVQPMALTAADQLTGPNALKVRTFSSRMEVQKKKSKVVPNTLAKNVAEWFFMPLIGGWWTQRQSIGNRSVTFSKHLLPLYLRTLAVLLHAAGPSTMALPQMTNELWDLLLSLRMNALHENDVKTLDAILFAFLTLLELNEDKQRLANQNARELVETQEWAKLVLDQYGSESSEEGGEGGKVKMLAAAVVLKCHEVVERWQRLMLGDMVDF